MRAVAKGRRADTNSNHNVGDPRPIRLDIAAILLCSLVGLTSGPSHAAAIPPRAEGSAQLAHTNRLIDSNDPYLLLHAHNPVDWYPWGPEALARAKKENRPIFVSFGYSTCYWCHADVQVIYPGSTLITPKFAPEGMQVYEGKVTLRATAPIGALTRGITATAELRVQACTDEICLPPAKVPITIEWK